MAKKKSSTKTATPRKIVVKPEAVEALGLPVDPAEQHAEIVRRLSEARPRGRPQGSTRGRNTTKYNISIANDVKAWLQNHPEGPAKTIDRLCRAEMAEEKHRRQITK